MRKTVFSMIAATFFLSGSGVANASTANLCTADSTDTTLTTNAKTNATKSIVGGLLGSFMKKAPTTPSTTKQDTLPQNNRNASPTSVQNILGGLVGSIAGNVAGLSIEKLAGTWNYTGIKCVLQSDNVMKKAGSEMLATPIENKINGLLDKVGIKNGTFTFTFAEDGTFSSVVAGRQFNGTYTLNTDNKIITLNYLNGAFKSEMQISLISNQLSLLHDSDKIFNLLTNLSARSSSRTMKTVNTMLSGYDGIQLGLEFTR